MPQITIPPLITLPKPPEWHECGDLNYVFNIRTINLSTFSINKRSHESFEMYNEKQITILSNSSQIVRFPILITTSLPAVCVLTVDSLLYKYKLSHNINIIPTNDTYPHIILFNYTKYPITLQPYQLSVYCRIVLVQKPKHFVHV